MIYQKQGLMKTHSNQELKSVCICSNLSSIMQSVSANLQPVKTETEFYRDHKASLTIIWLSV